MNSNSRMTPKTAEDFKDSLVFQRDLAEMLGEELKVVTKECDKLREQLAVAKSALTDIRNEVVITKLGEMQPDASLLKHYADEALAKLEKSDSCQK